MLFLYLTDKLFEGKFRFLSFGEVILLMAEAGRKILVLFSSPHSKGTCACMLEECLKCLSETDAVTHFDAFQMRPEPCIDCGWCKEHQGCVLPDLNAFMVAYEQADIVIICAPVYNLSFPAPLKSIFDRFQRYFNARFCLGIKPPIAKPKQALLLLCSGSKDKTGFDIIKKQAEMVFTVLNTTLSGMVCLPDTDKKPELDKALLQIRQAVSALQ